MTYANRSYSWNPGKIAAVAILVIIAAGALIAGIMYFTEPARSLPSVLGTITHPASRANAHRSTRGLVAIVVAVVFAIAAVMTARPGRRTDR